MVLCTGSCVIYLTVFCLSLVECSSLKLNSVKEQLTESFSSGDQINYPEKRVLYPFSYKHWVDVTGSKVPYTFDNGNGKHGEKYDKYEQKLNKNAMLIYERFTCVRFVQRTDEKYYIQFTDHDNGWWSYVGAGRPIRTSSYVRGLNKDNWYRECYACVHELGHALGFAHEAENDDPNNQLLTRNGGAAKRVSYVGFDSQNFMSDRHGGFREMLVGAQPTIFYSLKELSLLFRCQSRECS